MDKQLTTTPNLHTDKKINLILTNYANQFIKPKLITTNPSLYSDDKRFDNHTPFPERDNLALYAGKPVIESVTLESDNYEIVSYNDKTQSFEKSTINGVKLVLDTVLIDVSRSKNVVKTSIDGLEGTVKEFISLGDFEIVIRGAIVNHKGTNYPLEDMKKMIELDKAPVKVNVTSYLLSLYSIHYLVIERITTTQKEGYTNTQFFEMNCVSDRPLNIFKIKKS